MIKLRVSMLRVMKPSYHYKLCKGLWLRQKHTVRWVAARKVIQTPQIPIQVLATRWCRSMKSQSFKIRCLQRKASAGEIAKGWWQRRASYLYTTMVWARRRAPNGSFSLQRDQRSMNWQRVALCHSLYKINRVKSKSKSDRVNFRAKVSMRKLTSGEIWRRCRSSCASSKFEVIGTWQD